MQAVCDAGIDMVALEKDKIKGAVRTDFILSAEIIVISLGTVATATFAEQVAVVVGIALIMTVGVYGLVAGIVKLDDAGLYLSRRANGALQLVGRALLAAAPLLMKALSVLGTIAMFMVGGGILMHGVPALHHLVDSAAAAAAGVPGVGPVLKAVTPTVIDALAGVLAGAAALAVVTLGARLFGRKGAAA